MQTLGLIRYAFSASVVAIVLTGCGAAQPSSATRGAAPAYTPMPPLKKPKQSGWLSARASVRGEPLIYVADEYSSEVLVYPERGRSHQPVGMITGGVEVPWGLYIDDKQNLYVSNQYESTVGVYPPGATEPSLTYSQDLNRPLYCIADQYGDLFVGNANNGTVVEYLAGSSVAYEVLQTPGYEVDGLAFDRQGNLYVAYRNSSSSNSSIEEFPPHSSAGVILGMNLYEPQGLVVDDSGNIVVAETGQLDRVDVFPPGSKTPSQELSINGAPTELALTEKQSRLFISAETGVVYSVHYPLDAHPRLVIKENVASVIQGLALSNGDKL